MTYVQACRELCERLRPWQDLKAKVMLRVPVDYVLADGSLEPSPRPSDEAKLLLARIDAVMEFITANVANRVSSLDPPWFNPWYTTASGD